MNTDRIRMDFPIFSGSQHHAPLDYLDNAATTQKPIQVLRAMDEYYENANANPHRGVYRLAQASTEAYEKARNEIADFVGVRANELVFTKNATEGLNLAVQSIGRTFLKKDDLVLSTVLEHHSQLVPWQYHARHQHWNLEFCGVTSGGELDMADLEKKLARKPRVLAVTMASNVTGCVTDIETIASMAHDAGAMVIADATQAVPHLKVDFHKLGVDIAAFSGHKMLGPTGIGGVHIGETWIDELEPFLLGGDMIEDVTLEKTVFANGVQKFEAGTPNVAGAIGFAAAARYLKNIGMEQIARHEQKMRERMLDDLSRIPNLRTFGMPPKGLALASFNLGDIHPHDVATMLDREGICVRSGQHCAQPLMKALGIPNAVRASTYIYNNASDIERLTTGLQKAAQKFG